MYYCRNHNKYIINSVVADIIMDSYTLLHYPNTNVVNLINSKVSDSTILYHSMHLIIDTNNLVLLLYFS